MVERIYYEPSGSEAVPASPLIERLVSIALPPISLEKIDSASIETGQKLDKEHKWKDSARHFYTIWKEGQDPKIKSEAAISLSQQLINLGRFGQARKFIRELDEKLAVFHLAEREKLYFSARIHEKLAWVYDYEGNFEEEKNHLLEVKRLVVIQSNKNEEELLSTTTHFLGRATLGLALKIYDEGEREKGIREARSYFFQDLERYEKLKEKGTPSASGEVFQHLWISRCNIALGEVENAEEHMQRAWDLLQSEETTDWGILAHYNILKGALMLKKEFPTSARAFFETALQLRTTVAPYAKGKADALYGIAGTYFTEGKLGAAFYYYLQAVKAYPFLLVRGVL